MSITENIQDIIAKIKEINPECELVAATKTQSIEAIREAMATGLVLAAGENRVQELTEKYTPDFRWDFIGRLQTNKVKYIVDKVALIHSVDRLELAAVIEKESAKRNLTTDILMEINSGKEENKGGIFIEDAEKFRDELARYPHLRLRGMMAVAPIFYTEEQLRKTFEEVHRTFERLRGENFDYLSMGMSNDYLTAVKSGANLVRLGRAIFGARQY